MSDYYNKYTKAELKRLIKEREKIIEAQKKPRLADGRINPDYKRKPSPVVKDQLKKAKNNFTKRFGADGNKNRPDYKRARGGGGKSATGLGIKAPAGPSPRKKLKMLSKGGYAKSK